MSEMPEAPKRRGRPPRSEAIPQGPDIPAAPVTRRMSIKIRNRLKDPFGRGSLKIHIKDPSLHLRIVNSELRDDHLFEMTEKGWEFLTPEMLAVEPKHIGFRISTDGKVVRGSREQEVLMFMAEEHYRLIQQAKTARNLQGINSAQATHSQIVENLSTTFGDQAAEFGAKQMRGEIIDTRAPELLDQE